MKRIPVLIYLLVLVAAVQTCNAQLIYVKNYEVDEGSVFTVTIYASDISNVAGIDITLEYDHTLISAQKVSLNGSFSCGSGCFFFHNIMDGAVRIAIIDTNMINLEDCAVVDVEFKALRAGSTELRLHAELAKPSDGVFEAVESDVANGFVKVKPTGEQVTETVTRTPLIQTPTIERTPVTYERREHPVYEGPTRVTETPSITPVQTETVPTTTQVIKRGEEKAGVTPVEKTPETTPVKTTVTTVTVYGNKSYNVSPKKTHPARVYYDIIRTVKRIPGMEFILAVTAITLLILMRRMR